MRLASLGLPTLLAAFASANVPLSWGSIGDSWAAGVSYDTSLEFDKNTGHCLRTTESYPGLLQLYGDRWLSNGQNAAFAACCGSKLSDMASNQTGSKQEMAGLRAPDLMFMQAGSNDAYFEEVIDSCIYHADPTRTYDCDGAIQKATSYLSSTQQAPHASLQYDLSEAYRSIFRSPQANQGKAFYLYHIGYVHWFNAETSGNWCNSLSFGVTSQPLLNADLRQKLNSLISLMNDKIEAISGDFSKSMADTKQYLGFIDVSSYFTGHRFCEAAHGSKNSTDNYCNAWYGQYYRSDVWFWNLQFTNDQASTCGPTSSPNASHTAAAAANKGPVHNQTKAITLWPQTFSGGNASATGMRSVDGWHLRPFHPKVAGHAAVAGAIVARLVQDRVPGVSTQASLAGVAPLDDTLLNTNQDVAALLASAARGSSPAGVQQSAPSGYAAAGAQSPQSQSAQPSGSVSGANTMGAGMAQTSPVGYGSPAAAAGTSATSAASAASAPTNMAFAPVAATNTGVRGVPTGTSG